MADLTKKVGGSFGLSDSVKTSDNFVLNDFLDVSDSHEKDGRLINKNVGDFVEVSVSHEKDGRLDRNELNDYVDVTLTDEQKSAVVYEGNVIVNLSSDDNSIISVNFSDEEYLKLQDAVEGSSSDIDIKAVEQFLLINDVGEKDIKNDNSVETNIQIFDDGTVLFPELDMIRTIAFSDRVDKKISPAFTVKPIKGTYKGRVPIDIELFGEGVVDIEGEYLKNGSWKRAFLTNNADLSATNSSSSSSFSLSSSSASSFSLSSSSESYSSESISDSSISNSSSSTSSQSQSSSSSSQSISSESSSSVSHSSSSSAEIYPADYRLWWEADHDLYEDVTTRLRFFIKDTQLKKETNQISVDLDVAKAQMPLFDVNSWQNPTTSISPSVHFVPVNVEGQTVNEVKFNTSQYFVERKYKKYELLDNVDSSGLVFENDFLRLQGDKPILPQTRSLVTDGLVFGLDFKHDKDWVGNKLVMLNGTSVQDQFGNVDYAMYFENDDEMAEIPSHQYLDLNGIYSIVTWFKYPLESNVSTYNTLVRGSNKHMPVVVRKSDQYLGFYDTDASSFMIVDQNFQMSSLSTGWHFLVASANGLVTKYYIDNEYVGFVQKVSTDDIRSIGNYWGDDQQWGTLSDFRLYDKVLTADERELLHKGTGYEVSTGYCSDIVDAGSNVSWHSFEVDKQLQEGTGISYQFRTVLEEEGQSLLSEKSWISFDEGDLDLKNGRYVEWRANLTANSDLNKTPKLYNLNICYDETVYLNQDSWNFCWPTSFRYENYSHWRDLTKFQLDIDTNAGSVVLESDGTYKSSGYLTGIADAKRDVDWGKFESIETMGSGDCSITYQFRSATNNEGIYALGSKSFSNAVGDEISKNGRYLEWKAIFVTTDTNYTPLLSDLVLWCWTKKVVYDTYIQWNNCTVGADLEVTSDGVVQLVYGGSEYALSDNIEDVVDAGSDVVWQYWATDDRIKEDTDLQYFYRFATDAEGSGALSGKSWNSLTDKTNIRDITARYIGWKATLSSSGTRQNTPELKKMIFSWNEDEIQNDSIPDISEAKRGRLAINLIGRSDTHSRLEPSEELRQYIMVDDAIPTTDLAPTFQWTNAVDTDSPRQDFQYMFQLSHEDDIDNMDLVYEYSKSTQAELNDYKWKDASVSVSDGKVSLSSGETYGRLVYELGTGVDRIWQKFVAVDNNEPDDISNSVKYELRFSDDNEHWSDWTPISKKDRFLYKSRYFELRLILEKGSGPVYPEVSSVSLDAWDGSNMYVVDEGTTTTSFDTVDNLTNGKYYYYRVKAFDGVDFSYWSRTQAILASDTDTPYPAVGLQADGQTNPTHLVNFNPYFTWTFVNPGHSQTDARVQVGTSEGLWNMWDSGKVPTPSGVIYGEIVPDEVLADVPLERGQTYYWRVRVWNELDNAGEFSSSATFKLNQLPTVPEPVGASD